MVRRRIKEGELSWQFPAGAIEPDESDEDAAARERNKVACTAKAAHDEAKPVRRTPCASAAARLVTRAVPEKVWYRTNGGLPMTAS
ncbi:MAG: NUDIX hydrolase [Actinomycetes bacterium]